jgi:hypothetical protein
MIIWGNFFQDLSLPTAEENNFHLKLEPSIYLLLKEL